MRISWSNVTRVRALVLEMFGYDPVIYSFDQKPFHMNESGSKNCGSLSFRGASDVPCRENIAETRDRWTGNTLCISDEADARKIPFLEIMFNGGSGILRDLQTLETELRACGFQWLSLTTSDSGSYRAEHVLDYLDKMLEQLTPGRRIRILMCDAYKAHLVEAVRRFAWGRGYVVVYQGGGTTGVGQVNDTDLHETVSANYQDLEQEDHCLQTELNNGGCPSRDRETCVRDLCSVWKDNDLHAFAAQGFKRRGLSNALDGTEDERLSGDAAKVWSRIGMGKLRDLLVADVRDGHAKNEIPWTYRGVYDILEGFPCRGQMDVMYDGQEPQGADLPDEAAWSDRDDDVSDAETQSGKAAELEELRSCLTVNPPFGEIGFSERAAQKVAEHMRTTAVLDDMVRNAADLQNTGVLRALDRVKTSLRRTASRFRVEDFQAPRPFLQFGVWVGGAETWDGGGWECGVVAGGGRGVRLLGVGCV